jgi:hypothetical protein
MSRRGGSILVLVVLACVTYQAQSSSSGWTLTYSSRLDGAAIAGTATDSEGMIWAVGATRSPAIPTTSDALQPGLAGLQDVFLQRMRPDGTVLYLTYLGGAGEDWAMGISLDPHGNVYVFGATTSADFPTTAGAFDRTCGVDGTCQSIDYYVTKLTPDGRRLLYSTYLGGSAAEGGGAGFAVDAFGRAHVGGSAGSADYPLTAGAVRTVVASGEVVYTRLNAAGSALEYSTFIGGSSIESARALAVDASGNAYLTGQTASRDFTIKSAFQPASQSTSSTGWVAKFNDAGLVFSTYFGGSKGDVGFAIGATANALYVGGRACSHDFPGASRPPNQRTCDAAAFISALALDGSSLHRTVLLDGNDSDWVERLVVDADDVVFAAGATHSSDFPVTADAAQRTKAGATGVAPTGNVFFAVVPMNPAFDGRPIYATYLGGNSGATVQAFGLDGAGGAVLGGFAADDFPTVNGSTPSERSEGSAWIAHFAANGNGGPTASGDIVLYARDAIATAGNWRLVTDQTAAGGIRLWNPDAGSPKLTTAAAAPANYFEMSFEADAGVQYHLWLRMKADNNSWTNDSVFVQFSDTIDSSGAPVWRIGSTSATMVSLEDCSGCGEHEWGWNDNGYAAPGMSVVFATSGTHTLRVQQREDGVSIDQIVLSSRTFATAPPGAAKDDTTIVPQTAAPPPPPPPPPPPADPKEVVIYVAREILPGSQGWTPTADRAAAQGAALWNRNRDRAKSTSPSASLPEYFEVQFTAEAGIPYHLWVRARAEDDSFLNDSVFVQFSDSVNASGTPTFRIGSDAATNVILENCEGCGLQGWGWTDNSYGGFAAPMYFAKSGPQTIRVLRREDGISIDQIVLSAGRYLNAPPGVPKNDTTIVPK